MARIFRVCYMEEPFNLAELNRYKNYFEYSGNRRLLSQNSVRAMEDDYATGQALLEEEGSTEGYPTEEEYQRFKDLIGQEYDMLLNNEIDFVEFEFE